MQSVLKWSFHRGMWAGLATLCMILCGEVGGAQKSEIKERFEPVVRTLTTKDDLNLKATYYQSTRGKDAPVVVLLHMEEGNRMIWGGPDGFAARLQNDGFAVLTVDLRGHGDSKSDGAGDKKARKPSRKVEYAAMIEFDMEAVNRFLFEEHQEGNLNMNKTAFVGPEMGATIATYAAARDWAKARYDDAPAGSGRETPRGENVRALVLISPVQNLQGLPMAKPLKALGSPNLGMAFTVCVGERDGQDKGQAKKTFDQVSAFPNSKERMYYKEYPGNFRGTDLLGKPGKMEDNILAFLRKHLRDLDIPWTDRRPADERK